MALLQKEDILRGLSKIRSTKALADEIGLEDVGSALSLVETFYSNPKSVVDVGWVSAQRATQHNQDVGLRPTA